MTPALSVRTRVLSTGRRVAWVPGFRRRCQADRDWTTRARSRLPQRVRRMDERLALLVAHGFDPRSGRTLEVATGPGLDTRLLGALTEGRVYSIDLHQGAVPGAPGDSAHAPLHALLDRYAPLRVPALSDARRYRLLQMDGRALGFRDAAFDLVFCKSTLKLIPTPETALRECLRVLRPGGLLLVVDEPFTSLFGLCRGGVLDVPWAHVYLTDAEFEEVLPARKAARGKALRNWRAVSRLTPEALVETACDEARLLSARYRHDELPKAFFDAVFRIVPELRTIGAERLGIVEAELLFQRR